MSSLGTVSGGNVRITMTPPPPSTAPAVGSPLAVSVGLDLLVKAECLKTIPYSDKPLPQGGKIVQLTPEEAQEKFGGWKYDENLYGPKNDLLPYLTVATVNAIRNAPDQPKLEKVTERLQNPLKSLVVCNMGAVGHGLFASEDLQPGTILCTYSGEIEDAKIFQADIGYDNSWINQRFLGDLPSKAINSKHRGNLARFMQHLPTDYDKHALWLKQEMIMDPFIKNLRLSQGMSYSDLDITSGQLAVELCISSNKDKELEKLIFEDPQIKRQIATSNVCLTDVVINGIPIVVIWTQYGIRANEQIGWSYGLNYWETAGRNPCYFDQSGKIISKGLYTYKNPCDDFEKRPEQIYQAGVDEYKQNNYEQAIQYIKRAINIFASKGDKHKEIATCCSTLASCYRNQGKMELGFNACKEAIRIYYSLYKEGYKDKTKSIQDKYKSCLEGWLESNLVNSLANTLRDNNDSASENQSNRKLENKLTLNLLSELYNKSIIAFKESNYVFAIFTLEFILQYALANISPTDEAETKKLNELRGLCYSTLASCHREID